MYRKSVNKYSGPRDVSSFDSESDEEEDDMSSVLAAKAASQTR